jgi:predicted dehydrogenase
VGGGRIVGEACHFVDLLRFFAGCAITSHESRWMKSATADTATLNLGFADGSIGTIHYLANGAKSFPKERLEIFAGGGVLQLDNFRRLKGFGWPGFTSMNLWRQDKGQETCAAAFIDAIKGGQASPIPLDEIIEVSKVSIEISDRVDFK